MKHSQFLPVSLMVMAMASSHAAASPRVQVRDGVTQESVSSEVPDPDAFRHWIADLRRNAVHHDFAALHGDRIDRLVFALENPLGRVLPGKPPLPDHHDAKRPGYFTTNGTNGSALAWLVDCRFKSQEAAEAKFAELKVLAEIFREEMGGWELRESGRFETDSPEYYEVEATPRLLDGGRKPGYYYFGPQVVLECRLLDESANAGEPRWRVMAHTRGYADTPENPGFPNGEAARELIFPKEPIPEYSGDESADRLAWAFTRALQQGAHWQIDALSPTAEELHAWAMRAFEAGTYGDAPPGPFRDERVYLLEELGLMSRSFRWLGKSLATGDVVLDPAHLILTGVQTYSQRRAALPEDKNEWSSEDFDFVDRYDDIDGHFDDVVVMSYEARIPGGPPLLFEYEILMIKGSRRPILSGLGDGFVELPGQTVGDFVQLAGEAFLKGDQAVFGELLVDPDDVSWWLEHRAPKDIDAALEPKDFAVDAEEALRRYHLLREPLEREGLDSSDAFTVDSVSVISQYTLGATAQVMAACTIPAGGGAPRKVSFRLEVTQGPSGLRLPARGHFELVLREAEKPPLSDAGQAAREAEGAMHQPIGGSDWTNNLKQEAAFLAGHSELSRGQQVSGFRVLASSYAARHGKAAQASGEPKARVEDLLKAAEYYDRAHRIQAEGNGKADRGGPRASLRGDQVDPDLRYIAMACIRTASEAKEAGQDPASIAHMYEAAARAGSWGLRGSSPEFREVMAQSGFIAAQTLAERGEGSEALLLLQRFFAIEPSMENEELAAIAKRARVPVEWLYGTYRLLGTLSFNDALRMTQEFGASVRPRPALRLRALERLGEAKRAFLISGRAAPSGAPDEGFAAACDQLRDVLQQD